ncbi:MAG: hypothetical protein KDD25_03675, partial [Bdellovibrionales bacterium]|nr:hypothetical protein [Bdellovibrionales bacterium]
MKAILLLLLATLFSQGAGADDSSYSYRTKAGYEYVIQYSENGLWFVDHYEHHSGKLQERISSRSFTSESDAEKYRSELSKKIPKIEASKAGDFSNVETEINSKIWTAQNEWSWDWELKYAQWFDSIDPVNFFYNYQVETDCADAAIAFRWIFARINSLPAAQTLAGSNTLFSNESMKSSWRNLPTSNNWQDDELFRTALDYVLDNTFTHSLFDDSYPVKIDSTSLIQGTHHLDLYSTNTGHTIVLSDVNPFAPSIRVVYSNVPRRVRSLYEYSYWYSRQPAAGKGGFLRILWPVHSGGRLVLASKSSMPFFSNEQYAPGFLRDGRTFDKEVLFRINPNSDPIQSLSIALKDIEDQFKSRVDVVTDGYHFCVELNNDCSNGSEGWEVWSTPSRDRRVRDFILRANDIYSAAPDEPELHLIWNTYMRKAIELKGTSPFSSKTLGELIETWYRGS